MQTATKTHFNGHSMVGALDRVLVCPPRSAGWDRTRLLGTNSVFITPPISRSRNLSTTFSVSSCETPEPKSSTSLPHPISLSTLSTPTTQLSPPTSA